MTISNGPWIAEVAWSEATGVLKEAYDWQAERLGEADRWTSRQVGERASIGHASKHDPTGFSRNNPHVDTTPRVQPAAAQIKAAR